MDNAVAVFVIVGILCELVVTVTLINRSISQDQRIAQLEEEADAREMFEGEL